MTFADERRHGRELEYLRPWLQVATRGLSDESRERVRTEITAHFHDAVEPGLRAGFTEDSAAAKAVESLGSAKAARRAFRRTYLTRRQEAVLKQYGEPARLVSAGFGLLTTMVIWQAVLIEPRWTEPEWPLRIIAGIGMALALGILALVNPRIYRRGGHRTAFVAGVGANFLWWSCLAVAITGKFATVWWLSPLVLFAIASYTPLVRKLHNQPAATCLKEARLVRSTRGPFS